LDRLLYVKTLNNGKTIHRLTPAEADHSQSKVSIEYRAVLLIGIDLMPIRIRISMLMPIQIRIHADPTLGFTHVGKSEYFFNFYFLSQHCQFKNFLEKSKVYKLFHLLGIITDSDRRVPDRHALDANPDLDPYPAK
jgi:hypothetical protein